MKKFFTVCVCALMATLSIFAQDIIVTKDAKKIEAKILEVSKSEIKYKEMDNIEGPTFILEANEISSVIYANGKVVLYDQEQKAEVTVQKETPSIPVIEDNSVVILLRSGRSISAQIVEMKEDHIVYILNDTTYTLSTSQIDRVTLVQNGQVRKYAEDTKSTKENNEMPTYYISRSGNTYYYGYRQLRGDAYARFLENTCPTAYQQYTTGHNASTLGWILFGVGLGLDVGFSWWLPFAWIPALGCEIVSIPTLIVGYVTMHKSATTFNADCVAKKSNAYWSINASKNGIGIAYNF